MTQCVVTCPDCEKTWHWLCELCAEDCQNTHRVDTGHRPELQVTVSPDLGELITQARQVLGRAR
jgi:hypothetical protein